MTRASKSSRTKRVPAIRAKRETFWTPDRFLGEVYRANPAIRIMKLDYRRSEDGKIRFTFRIAGTLGVTEIEESPYNLEWWTDWFARDAGSKESA